MEINQPVTADELLAAARKEQDAHVATRIQAIRMVILKKTRQETSEALGLSSRQIQNLIHRFNEFGLPGLYDRPRPGQPTKLSRDREAAFIERMERGALETDGICSLRGHDLRRILSKEFNAEYSLGGVYFLLHRLNFSCRVPRPENPSSSTEVQDAFKKTTGNAVGNPNTAS